MAASTSLIPQLAATAATTALNLPQRRADAQAQSLAAQQQVASLQRRRSLITGDFESGQSARRLSLRRNLGGARVSAAARGIAGDGGSEAALEQAQQSRHSDATASALAQRNAALADNGAALSQAEQQAQLAERERRLASSPARAIGRSLLDTATHYAIQQISLIR